MFLSLESDINVMEITTFRGMSANCTRVLFAFTVQYTSTMPTVLPRHDGRHATNKEKKKHVLLGREGRLEYISPREDLAYVL